MMIVFQEFFCSPSWLELILSENCWGKIIFFGVYIEVHALTVCIHKRFPHFKGNGSQSPTFIYLNLQWLKFNSLECFEKKIRFTRSELELRKDVKTDKILSKARKNHENLETSIDTRQVKRTEENVIQIRLCLDCKTITSSRFKVNNRNSFQKTQNQSIVTTPICFLFLLPFHFLWKR